MAHKFNPEHIYKLLSEERARELAPERLLREAGLKPGDFFADIGSGPGFFTVPAAGIIGAEGVAFAIDTEERMLLELRDKRNPPDNVVLLKSEEYEIPLNDADVDFALIAYTLHETDDKVRFLREAGRIIRPGGTLLVIEWEKIEEEKGPPMHERISPEEASALLASAGFSALERASINPSHYMIRATRP